MIMESNSATDARPDTPVSQDLWKQLFVAAGKVREMEPWRWMEETDIFGVKDPDSGTILFVSVMGLLGEYHAVALYIGAKAVTQFWQAHEMPDQEQAASVLIGTRQLHAAFGRKGELDPQEKAAIRELGLTFKGAHAWPYFRSYRPGYFPWVVDAEEARLLLLALEQLLAVAPRVKEDRRLIARKPGTCTYLVRVSDPDGESRVWRDERQECPPPATTFRVQVPTRLMDAVRALPPGGGTIEMDVAPSPMPIGERGKRLQMPYLMLALDRDSRFVLGFEMLTVEGEFESLWAKVPAAFLNLVSQLKARPAALALRPSWVPMVMDGVCKELQIAVQLDPQLEALTQMRRDLESFRFR